MILGFIGRSACSGMRHALKHKESMACLMSVHDDYGRKQRFKEHVMTGNKLWIIPYTRPSTRLCCVHAIHWHQKMLVDRRVCRKCDGVGSFAAYLCLFGVTTGALGSSPRGTLSEPTDRLLSWLVILGSASWFQRPRCKTRCRFKTHPGGDFLSMAWSQPHVALSGMPLNKVDGIDIVCLPYHVVSMMVVLARHATAFFLGLVVDYAKLDYFAF